MLGNMPNKCGEVSYLEVSVLRIYLVTVVRRKVTVVARQVAQRLSEPMTVQAWVAAIVVRVTWDVLTTSGTVIAQIPAWGSEDILWIHISGRRMIACINIWWLGFIVSFFPIAPQTSGGLIPVGNRHWLPRIFTCIWVQVIVFGLHVVFLRQLLLVLDPLKILITSCCYLLWNNL